MAQEIEIEFKTLLCEEDFQNLLESLPFPEQPFHQTNHYFDTKDMKLKKHASALRIREKEGRYTLTLKQPHDEGILETHDTLNQEELEKWLKNEPAPKTHTAEELKKMSVQMKELVYYGALETARYAYTEKGLEYVLDRSDYLGNHDFELEIEASTYDSGLNIFEGLLRRFQIDKQQPITKIERFFSALNSRQ